MRLFFLKKKLFTLQFAVALFFLSSCQVTLAPAYDQAIVEKVIDSSEQVMRFFATLENGTQVTYFSTREATYNQLIGVFESLKIQTRARPIPDTKATARINEIFHAKGTDIINEAYPSAYAFERIAETFRKMKKFDSEEAMDAAFIAILKGQVEIYLDQAITYENFLKR
jgi:hypothetical protein